MKARVQTVLLSCVVGVGNPVGDCLTQSPPVSGSELKFLRRGRGMRSGGQR